MSSETHGYDIPLMELHVESPGPLRALGSVEQIPPWVEILSDKFYSELSDEISASVNYECFLAPRECVKEVCVDGILLPWRFSPPHCPAVCTLRLSGGCKGHTGRYRGDNSTVI